MFIFIFFIVVSFFGCFFDGFFWFFVGCGRKFKNGRKCKMWSCPNHKECPFFNNNESRC